MLLFHVIVCGFLNLSGIFEVVLFKSPLSDLIHELSLSVAVHHFHECPCTDIEFVPLVVIHGPLNNFLLVNYCLNGQLPEAEVLLSFSHLSPNKVVAKLPVSLVLPKLCVVINEILLLSIMLFHRTN